MKYGLVMNYKVTVKTNTIFPMLLQDYELLMNGCTSSYE